MAATSRSRLRLRSRIAWKVRAASAASACRRTRSSRARIAAWASGSRRALQQGFIRHPDRLEPPLLEGLAEHRSVRGVDRRDFRRQVGGRDAGRSPRSGRPFDAPSRVGRRARGRTEAHPERDPVEAGDRQRKTSRESHGPPGSELASIGGASPPSPGGRFPTERSTVGRPDTRTCLEIAADSIAQTRDSSSSKAKHLDTVCWEADGGPAFARPIRVG